MHDPMTQLLNWPKYPRRTLLTVWHVDPESDGSDDSCGWFSPKLTKAQLERLETIARDEARTPWFQRLNAKTIDSPTEAETLLAGAFWLVARVLQQNVLSRECRTWAQEGLHNDIDNFRSALCFQPGYHGNRQTDNIRDREMHAMDLFKALARWILRARRPWYRHPRWHVWHWHFQIHPLQSFKRWAFSRCCKCGGRFPYGATVMAGSWDSEGPRWFRSERQVYHSDCRNPKLDPMSACVANPTTGLGADAGNVLKGK